MIVKHEAGTLDFTPSCDMRILKCEEVNVMNKQWFKAAAIRAIKTVAQSAIATIGTSIALGEVDWVYVASASILAGILSILTSIAGLPEVNEKE